MQLSDWLTEKKIMPSKFAELVSVDKSTVSRWLDGSLRPGWESLKRIGVVTAGQVTANDFIGVQESVPNPNGQEGSAVAQG